MVRPTQEELNLLKQIKTKTGSMVYGQMIRKIEDGFDVKEFCDNSAAYLYKNHVPYLFTYYAVYAIFGIIFSRRDCSEKYCYNVNQFIWVFYGCVAIGHGLGVILVNLRCCNEDTSEFIYYFNRINGIIGDIQYFSGSCFGMLVVGTIVHIIYMTKTDYMLAMQLVMVITNLIYMTVAHPAVRNRVRNIADQQIREIVVQPPPYVLEVQSD